MKRITRCSVGYSPLPKLLANSALTVSVSSDKESTSHGDTEYELIEKTQTPFTPFSNEVLVLATKADTHKVDTLVLRKFIREQSKGADCRAAFSSVAQPNSRLDVDTDGELVRVSPLDGSSTMYAPATFRDIALYLSYHSLLAGHPNERRMYDPMRKELYWPRMTNDVYSKVREFRSCAKKRIDGM